ncbi:hypothetical protein BT93_F1627 [Corymbia citriodora subsp. variegata]|nr:hypothetical protein BT93_F1627 [Corymbia citriodora subsp. variegata]
MDTAQWPSQDTRPVKGMEETSPNACNNRAMLEKRARPQEQLNCPRCNSNNTKFCYYNNYSLTQPRYFCKTCRRYWTDGGSLRNVPVGGGSRKNKKVSTSSTSSSPSASSRLPDLNPSTVISHFSAQNPKAGLLYEGQDLNLGFPATQEYHATIAQYVQLPKVDHETSSSGPDNNSSAPSSALELLRNSSSGMGSRGLSLPFLPANIQADSNALYSSAGFNLQELKPSLSFSVDSRYASAHGVVHQENGGKLLFPFGGMMKQLSSTNGSDHVDHNGKGQSSSSAYWNGVLGGGSW